MSFEGFSKLALLLDPLPSWIMASCFVQECSLLEQTQNIIWLGQIQLYLLAGDKLFPKTNLYDYLRLLQVLEYI